MTEPKDFVEPLIEDIFARRTRFFTREQSDRAARNMQRTTKRNPVASNAHIECRREMYHRLVNWKDLPEFDVETLARMKHGTAVGKIVRRDFEDWGLNIVHGESPIVIQDRKGRKAYTGMIDFGVQIEGTGIVVPVEVKSMSVFAYDGIIGSDDLEKKFWTKKYRRQLLIYLLGRDIEVGILALYHRGWLKLVPLRLTNHLDEAEECLQAAEAALDAVESGDPPPYAEDPEECRRCGFFGRSCNPPIAEDLTIFADEEFEGEVNEMLDLKEGAKRYEYLKKAASKRIIAAPGMTAAAVVRAVLGKIGIEVKEKKRGAYAVKESTYREVRYYRTEEVKPE